ncbi:MAG: peptidase S10 [Pirellulales bacterium]
MPRRVAAFLIVLLLVAACPLDAQEKERSDRGSPPEPKKKAASKVVHEPLSVTKHTATIEGEEIEYTATVGRIYLKGDKDQDRAQVYYFAYTRDGVEDQHERPITFSFNGGPGSSSVWLHLGLMGPKRVPVPDDATQSAPPYELVPNEHSLLDLTDIVMIDPVSTGISRQEEGTEAREFHGYEEDINSVGDFIERYISTNERWESPKFLLGESYGTTRAAGLADYLQDTHGMYLNGIAMVSSVLNFQTLRFDVGNDLPFVLFLPSYTATAWYHEQLEEELQRQALPDLLREVEEFAAGEYNTALLRGARMSDEEEDEIAAKLARYTGLSKEFVLRTNLRIEMRRFAKELLRDRRRTTGRLDSRFLGIDRDAAGDSYDYDPSDAAILGPFTALLNEYLRDDLAYEPGRKYNIYGSVRPWNYDEFTNRYLDASESLRKAMTRNPALQVFIASGYYDLATPYFASDFTYNQLQLDPTLRDNLHWGYYEAGHMMYIHTPSLEKLKEDLTEFYEAASPEE